MNILEHTMTSTSLLDEILEGKNGKEVNICIAYSYTSLVAILAAGRDGSDEVGALGEGIAQQVITQATDQNEKRSTPKVKRVTCNHSIRSWGRGF